MSLIKQLYIYPERMVVGEDDQEYTLEEYEEMQAQQAAAQGITRYSASQFAKISGPSAEQLQSYYQSVIGHSPNEFPAFTKSAQFFKYAKDRVANELLPQENFQQDYKQLSQAYDNMRDALTHTSLTEKHVEFILRSSMCQFFDESKVRGNFGTKIQYVIDDTHIESTPDIVVNVVQGDQKVIAAIGEVKRLLPAEQNAGQYSNCMQEALRQVTFGLYVQYVKANFGPGQTQGSQLSSKPLLGFAFDGFAIVLVEYTPGVSEYSEPIPLFNYQSEELNLDSLTTLFKGIKLLEVYILQRAEEQQHN